jgi:hypothetical protein
MKETNHFTTEAQRTQRTELFLLQNTDPFSVSSVPLW